MKNTFLLFALAFSSFGTFAQTPIVIAALDSCNFESPCDMVVLDSISSGIWQIGQPHKIIFDSAYSPVNVIVTDTLNTYPIGQDCSFEVLVRSEWQDDDLRLTFHHRFNTDTLLDGGYIEVSFDDGMSWENILNSSSPLNQHLEFGNFYSYNNALKDGMYGFSGNSDGWITSSIIWRTPRVRNTEVSKRLRFHFISDGIETNKEGWMIDDLYVEELQHLSGIEQENSPTFSFYPNPAKDFIELNFKKQITRPMTITIYNLLGQEIKTFNTTNSQKLKIDISELNKGFYILKITQGNQYLGSSKWQKI